MDEQELLQAAVSISSETDPDIIAFHLRRLCNQSARGAINMRDAAYYERAQLVAFLTHIYPAYLATPRKAESWDDNLTHRVIIESPAGDISWYIHDTELSLFSHLEEMPYGNDDATRADNYKCLAICGEQESLKDELLGSRAHHHHA